MESWWPYVIGATAFFYVQSYNRIAKMYFESEKTLSWNDLFTKVIPLESAESGNRTHADYSRGS